MTTPRIPPRSWTPPPVEPKPAWMKRALCLNRDPEAFFPEPIDSAYDRRGVEACASCEVRADCKDYIMIIEHGLDDRSRYGIWAGLTPAERAREDRTARCRGAA